MPLSDGRAKLFFGVVIAMSLAISGLVIWQVVDRRNQDKETCQRLVEAREDNRAMWDYLILTNPNPDEERVVAFREVLNNRLPHLECHGDDPVPVPIDGEPQFPD